MKKELTYVELTDMLVLLVVEQNRLISLGQDARVAGVVHIIEKVRELRSHLAQQEREREEG
jgi:hypothetical protein